MIKKYLKNEKGVALILVLSALVMLSTVVVEFAYNAHIAFITAANERDRLQAYYLARSAMNFAKLQISLEKALRQRFSKYSKYLQGYISSEPFCKQLPFSTTLFRGLMDMAGGEEEEGLPEELEEEGGAGGLMGLGVMGSINAEDLLSFEGDFSIECDDEQGRINLNYFRDVEKKADISGEGNAYEAHKKLLENLMAQGSFEKILENRKDDIRDIVNNIADWVDSNDRINEAPGISGGYENSVFAKSDVDYKVKNGKFFTIAELLLIEGIGDDLYKALLPHVTVYGDDKLNPCLASDDMIVSFVMRYSEQDPSVPVISSDKDERVSLILEDVHEACMNPSPNVNDVAQAITSRLGTQETQATEEKGKTTKKTTQSSSLASQLTTTNRFYRLNLVGTVGDISMRIQAILDTKGAISNWKLLYYRVE